MIGRWIQGIGVAMQVLQFKEPKIQSDCIPEQCCSIPLTPYFGRPKMQVHPGFLSKCQFVHIGMSYRSAVHLPYHEVKNSSVIGLIKSGDKHLSPGFQWRDLCFINTHFAQKCCVGIDKIARDGINITQRHIADDSFQSGLPSIGAMHLFRHAHELADASNGIPISCGRRPPACRRKSILARQRALVALIVLRRIPLCVFSQQGSVLAEKTP